MIWIAVGLGGALGAATRAFLTDVLVPRLPESLPYPTLLINVVACFSMGVLANLAMGHVLQLALCMGFLGGFSTLSAVCWESVGYFREKRYGRCFGYLVLTHGVALLSTAAGFLVVCALGGTGL